MVQPRPLTLHTAAVIRGLMGEHGITQTAIGDRLGRGQSYVSPRVNGKLAFDLNELEAIAELFKMTGTDLLFVAIERTVRGASQTAAREGIPTLSESPRGRGDYRIAANESDDQGEEDSGPKDDSTDDDRGPAR